MLEGWTPEHAHAWEAAQEFTRRCGVFFGPRGPRQVPDWIGSGTSFATPGGRVVILTAKHNFYKDDDWKEPHLRGDPFAMGFPLCVDAIGDAIETWIEGPADVDVALALLRPHAELRVRPFASSPDLVADAADSEVDNDVHWCIAAGYPWAQHFRGVSHALKVNVIGFPPIAYGCGDISRDEKRRYCIEWKHGIVMPGMAERFPYADVTDGELRDLPRPHGISGGALWRFGRLSADAKIWFPDRVARLVGVPHAFRDGVQLAESVEKWGDWFRHAIQEFDSPK